MNMNKVISDIEKEFPKQRPKPEPSESPVNEEKCKSCGMWESECICED